MQKLLAVIVAVISTSAAWADVTLPTLIDSKMVPQRDTEVSIWGWADEGETVTVKFGGQTQTAVATGEKDGKEVARDEHRGTVDRLFGRSLPSSHSPHERGCRTKPNSPRTHVGPNATIL